VTPLVVDIKEAAKAIGVSPWTVRNYIATGLLPRVVLPSAKRPGEPSRSVRISVADLEIFVAKYRETERVS
jgi:predicted site-specific integrase-resolvase